MSGPFILENSLSLRTSKLLEIDSLRTNQFTSYQVIRKFYFKPNIVISG